MGIYMKRKKYNTEDWGRNDGSWGLVDADGREVLFREDCGDRVIGYVREYGEQTWTMAVVDVRNLYMVQDEDKVVLGVKWTLKKRCDDGTVVGDDRVSDVEVVGTGLKEGTRRRIWKKIMDETGERIRTMDGVKRFEADREHGTVELVGEKEEERWFLFEREIDI